MVDVLKALAWIAPNAAMKRARALAALDAAKRYAGGTGGRRGATFSGAKGSANTRIAANLSNLRTRSREMVEDSWMFQRILDVTVSHSCGYGFAVLPDNGSDVVDNKVKSLWEEWSAQADVTGEQDFNGLLALAVRSMLEGGDSVIRMMDLKKTDERAIPFGLQLWEGDIIDESKNTLLARADDKSRMRLGVELGPLGERLGYWLHPDYPGEQASLSSLVSTRVSREYIIHLMKQQRPGQVRGVPVFAPILLTSKDLYDFMDSVLMKAKVEACFAAFITTEGEVSPLDALNKTDASGLKTTELYPGMMTELKQGQDVTFANPSSTANTFEPIYDASLRAMAAGAGITYDQLTGDLRQANYSSLRAGKIEFRRMIEHFQWLVLKPRVLDRITERFVSRAILAGKLLDRRAGYKWKFVMPANEPIDPLKDLQADIQAVRTGRMTPQEYYSSWGNDWKKNLSDLKAFTKELDRLDLTLDIDPRKVNQGGAMQPVNEPATPPPPTPAVPRPIAVKGQNHG